MHPSSHRTRPNLQEARVGAGSVAGHKAPSPIVLFGDGVVRGWTKGVGVEGVAGMLGELMHWDLFGAFVPGESA